MDLALKCMGCQKSCLKASSTEVADALPRSDVDSSAFPRVEQTTNDTFIDISHTVCGRGSGASSVKFIIRDILGKGHYGMVFLAREEDTKRLFAIKMMNKTQRHIHKYAHVEEAILRMSKSCVFVVQLHSSFQSTHHYYLVLEYAEGGNLKQIVDVHGCLGIPAVRFITAELVMALIFLHAHGVIHRDLKIQNILMTKERHVRLIDFGLSRIDIFDGDTTNSGCGTPYYMAPEILRRAPYAHEVDWWSLGVICYKLVTGTFPFTGKTNPEVFMAAARDAVHFDPGLSPELVSFLKGLLKKNPTRRLGYGRDGWKRIQTHEFFKNLDWYAVSEQSLTPPRYDSTQQGATGAVGVTVFILVSILVVCH